MKIFKTLFICLGLIFSAVSFADGNLDVLPEESLTIIDKRFYKQAFWDDSPECYIQLSDGTLWVSSMRQHPIYIRDHWQVGDSVIVHSNTNVYPYHPFITNLYLKEAGAYDYQHTAQFWQDVY